MSNILIRRILRRFNSRKYVTILLLITLSAFLVFFKFTNNQVGNSYEYVSKFSPFELPKVSLLTNLHDVDITEILKAQESSLSFIRPGTSEILFKKEKVVGYVSNLQMTKFQEKVSKKRKTSKKKDKKGVTEKPAVEGSYDSVVECTDLAYETKLMYHVFESKGHNDILSSRKQILDWNNDISNLVIHREEEKSMTIEQVIKEHWFEFGHVTVWFQQEECYLVYSRLMYIRQPHNTPIASFIKATAFDKDWNEIKGKRIPYNDVQMPKDIETELALLDTQLNLAGCEIFQTSDSTTEYQECIRKQSSNRLRNMKRKEVILDKYFITYPTVLKFDFKVLSKWSGPEDPRVIMRKDNIHVEEPVIIFDLDDGTDRGMFSLLPHRRTAKITKFSLDKKDGQLGKVEKNWTPFFLPEVDDQFSTLSSGYIHFVYSFFPLRILRCSLDDGVCEEVFSGETLGLVGDSRYSDFRGGSQFVTLPETLPGLEGKNVWISVAKTHTQKCGCGNHFYRAALTVMIESNGVYHLGLITPGLGFGLEPINFSMTGTYCDNKNVISPNSIVSWYISSQDVENKSFEDYLTISVSEGDMSSKYVIIKNVLNYIIDMYKVKDIQESFEIDNRASEIIRKNVKCVSDRIGAVCKEFGKAHPPPESPESPKPPKH